MKEYNRIVFVSWLKRIVFPMIFVTSLVFFTSYIFYKGQKHRRIIAKIEDKIIDLTFFSLGPREVVNPDKLLHIDFDHGVNTKLNWVYKLKMIEKIYKKNPRILYISGLSKEKNLQKKFLQIINIVNTRNLTTKVIIAIDPKDRRYYDSPNFHNFFVLENDPCEDNKQRICTYNPKWSHWINQFLFKNVFDESRSDIPYSKVLPRIYPSYLLYFGDYFNSLTLSPQNKKGDSLDKVKNKIVFLDLLKKNKRLTNENKITSHFNPSNYSRTNFWYDVVQVFVDNDFLYVSKYYISLFVLFFSILIVFILVFYFDSFVLFFLLVLFILLLLSSNLFLVHFFRVYIPLSNVVFIDILFMIFLVYIKLSYSSFRKDIELINEKNSYEDKFFKKIVISIISHNLNTPLAQVQGLFEITKASLGPDSNNKSSLSELEVSLSRSYLSIKIFLTMISIQNNRVQILDLNFNEFASFFKKESKLCLDNLTVSVEILYDESTLVREIYCSPSVLSYLVFCCCYHFLLKNKVNCFVDFMISYDNRSEKTDIYIDLLCGNEISNSFLRYLNNSRKETLYNDGFLTLLTFRYIETVKKISDINFLYRENQGQFILSMKLTFYRNKD